MCYVIKRVYPSIVETRMVILFCYYAHLCASLWNTNKPFPSSITTIVTFCEKPNILFLKCISTLNPWWFPSDDDLHETMLNDSGLLHVLPLVPEGLDF